IDPAIDPVLYTPSKRMRMLTGALASTSSGSFLVSSAAITSALTVTTSFSSIPAPVLEGPPALPEPDWAKAAYLDESMDRWSQNQLLEYAKGTQGDLENAHQHIRARDGIIESSHATIVVQNLFVEKQ
ncbi:hypothetical protein B0H17DRAFT_837705, partial [Mycena rosella]